jgi:hypothetical protein
LHFQNLPSLVMLTVSLCRSLKMSILTS